MEIMQNWKERSAVLGQCVNKPRFAYSLLRTGLFWKDPVFLEQFRWVHGTLPRVPLQITVPEYAEFDLHLVRPFDRQRDTSITIEELCSLLAIAKKVNAKRILELGTFDGNTTLNLAANTEADIVTVDLPPDFNSFQAQGGDSINNMTTRTQLGRQLCHHPLAPRIRQVFGDSMKLDWDTLGTGFDLIFIDACHKYSYVLSDTKNALARVSKGGAIVWHDYGIFEDVSRVVDMTAQTTDLTVNAIEGTRLAVGLSKR
jgi:predicted O-methyltransferase YrrM